MKVARAQAGLTVWRFGRGEKILHGRAFLDPLLAIALSAVAIVADH